MKVWKVRLLLALACLLALAGCASIGPPEAPSLELPKPPADLRAARKGDKVTLTWTVPARTTERQSLKYLGKTQICRSLAPALKQCGTEVGTAAPPADFESTIRSGKKLAASFVDTLPLPLEREHPRDSATYAVEVLNQAGRGAGLSNEVRVPLVPTLPPFAAFAAQVTARGVLISWKCSAESGTNGVQYLFRIYRQPDQASPSKLADVPVTDCVEGRGEQQAASSGESEASNLQSSYLDQTFEWEKTYSYRATVVSVIETAGKPSVEVEGTDTPEVKVFAHDVFPPAVPAGLQAVFSGPGQARFIDLIWTPVSDADLAGYNVYRHEAGQPPIKLNQDLVRTPAFRDLKVTPGKIYFYSVSAVDERGNESAKSEEASETAGP
ncbi:MAG TPA: hypothetical protein VGG14_17935 [Candidatus Sulfotelmatobacter sp.]